MIFDLASVILVVAISIFLVAVGGLISSLINRRALRKIDGALAELGQKVDHTNRNAKQAKIALEHFNAKAEVVRAEALKAMGKDPSGE